MSMSRVHVSVIDLRSPAAALVGFASKPLLDVYLAACGLPDLNGGEGICTEIY